MSLVSTTRRAKVIILLIVITGFTLGSYPLFTIGVRRSKDTGLLKCLIKDQHGWAWNVYMRLNTAVLMFGTLVIPAIIISIITGVIVTFLSRAARRRQSMQMDGQVIHTRSLFADVSHVSCHNECIVNAHIHRSNIGTGTTRKERKGRVFI